MRRSFAPFPALALLASSIVLTLAPMADASSSAPRDPVSSPLPGLRDSALRLYVPNQLGASVSVLDGRGNPLATVDLTRLGFSARAMPHQVAAEPDGSAWYVTLAGAGEVLKFDRGNRLVARTEVEAPGMIVLDPVRDRLYASRALAAVRPPSSLAMLRASDLALLEEPEIFVSRPHALAVDTISGRVYSGSLVSGSIASFDPRTGEVWVATAEEAPNGFVGLAPSPDGARLVATTQLTDRMLALDTADPARMETVASLSVEPGPYDAAYSPDGRTVWFPNQRGDAVTRVDAATWTVSDVIRHQAFAEPHGVVLAPDGRTVYVTSHGRVLGEPEDPSRAAAREQGSGGIGPDLRSPRGNGTVAILDAATGKVRSVTEVGPYAAAPGLGGGR